MKRRLRSIPSNAVNFLTKLISRAVLLPVFISAISGTTDIKAKIIVPDRDRTVSLSILRNRPYYCRLLVVLFRNSALGLRPRTAHRNVMWPSACRNPCGRVKCSVISRQMSDSSSVRTNSRSIMNRDCNVSLLTALLGGGGERNGDH